MGAMTGHPHSRTGQRHRGRLALVFALVAVFMVIELIAGWLTGSLALISDAGHMATDALGLGMALAAIVVANRIRSPDGKTYGWYRLEILAALANSALLFILAGYVIYEAARRGGDPPLVDTTPMLVVAAAGLAVNIIGWRLLRSGAQESLNVKGAYFEVVADLAASIGTIVAALVMILFEWPYADPIIAVLIGLWILPRAWRLGGEALRVLIQGAPEGMDLDALQSDLAAIAGVTDVHDLHVWTLTSEMDVATVHLMTSDGTDPHPVLDRARDLLERGYGVSHATLQVEPDSHQGCSEVSW